MNVKNPLVEKRATMLNIAGEEYPLTLSIGTVYKLRDQYGGLDGLNEEIQNAEEFEDGLNKLAEFVCLLVNDAVNAHNYRNPGDKKPEIPLEKVMEALSYSDLTELFEMINGVITKASINFIPGNPLTSPKKKKTP